MNPIFEKGAWRDLRVSFFVKKSFFMLRKLFRPFRRELKKEKP
jgi:hypothetical protein